MIRTQRFVWTAFIVASLLFFNNDVAAFQPLSRRNRLARGPPMIDESHDNKKIGMMVHHCCNEDHDHHPRNQCRESARTKTTRRILGSLWNVLKPAGFASSLDDVDASHHLGVVHTAGPLRFVPKTIKKLHNPITYFLLGLGAGFRYNWCFQSPLYYFAMGFCIKWYRARYVFRIPVWDRQPNWNNVITEKSQEKDLKALTCKNCGSTLFIAKTREFFFEGSTGIGGLGCFTCGKKGADNFIMDRDRIVEDVGDMDDYFEYERPLDFVSRAERRKLLKEAAGDENKANQLLLERTNGSTANGASTPPAAPPSEFIEAEVQSTDASEIQQAPKKKKKKKKKKKVTPDGEIEVSSSNDTKPAKAKKPAKPSDDADDDLSALDMDAW